MRKAAVLSLALVAALAALPGASGKGVPTAVRVCGASGCATSTTRILLDGDRAQPAPPGRFYTVTPLDGDGTLSNGFYLPAAGVFRGSSTVLSPWVRLFPAADSTLRATARHLVPFAAPRVVGALVDGKGVAHPAAYAGLLAALPAVASPPSGSWIEIRLHWSRPSPWVDSSGLQYQPATHVLFRDYAWVRVPAALAGRIERDAGLAPRRR